MTGNGNMQFPLAYRLVAILICVLVGCSTQTDQPVTPIATAPTQTDPNSGPHIIQTINSVPTPSRPNLVTITGQLQYETTAPKPAAGAILYLAGIITDDQGHPVMANLDLITSPRTQADINGRFVFADMEPQKYALALYLLGGSVMLNDPVTGGDFLFEPSPGEVLDLGKLTYAQLPGFGNYTP